MLLNSNLQLRAKRQYNYYNHYSNCIGFTHSLFNGENTFISNIDLQGEYKDQYVFNLTKFKFDNINSKGSIIETDLDKINRMCLYLRIL